MHLWPRPAVMSQSYITTAGEKFSDCRSTNSRLSGGATAFYSLTRPLVCGLGNRPIRHKPGRSDVTSVARTWAGCLRCNLKKKDRSSSILTRPWTDHSSQHPTSVTKHDPIQSPTLWDSTWAEATWLPQQRSLGLFSVERLNVSMKFFFLPHQDCEAP